MAVLTYAEIRKMQDEQGLGDMPTATFARTMQSYDVANDYSQGIQGGLGSVVKAASYGLDRVIEATGAPDALAFAGEMIDNRYDSSTGRHVFADALRRVPRGFVNDAASVLPVGRVAKVLGSATLNAADTYEQTGSAAAGVLAGTIAGATPKLMDAAGELATRNAPMRTPFAWIRSNGQDVGTNFGQRQILAGDAAVEAVKLGQGVFLQSPGFAKKSTVVKEFLAKQSALAASNIATSAAVGAVAAPDGERWNAFKAAFSPEQLLVQATIQTGLTGLSAPGFISTTRKAGDQYTGVHARELSRWQKALNTEQEAIAGVSAELNAPRPLALPESSSVERSRFLESMEPEVSPRAEELYRLQRDRSLEQFAAVEGLTGPRTFTQSAEGLSVETPSSTLYPFKGMSTWTGDVATLKGKVDPAVVVDDTPTTIETNEVATVQQEMDSLLAMLDNPETVPEAKLEASMQLTGDGPTKIAEEVKQLVEEGQSPEEAVKNAEKGVEVKARGTKKGSKWDAANRDIADWATLRFEEVPDEGAVVAGLLNKFSSDPDAPQSLTTYGLGEYRKWLGRSEDKADVTLESWMNQALSRRIKEARADKSRGKETSSRESVSAFAVNGQPEFTFRKALLFKTKAAADAEKVRMQGMFPQYKWETPAYRDGWKLERSLAKARQVEGALDNATEGANEMLNQLRSEASAVPPKTAAERVALEVTFGDESPKIVVARLDDTAFYHFFASKDVEEGLSIVRLKAARGRAAKVLNWLRESVAMPVDKRLEYLVKKHKEAYPKTEFDEARAKQVLGGLLAETEVQSWLGMKPKASVDVDIEGLTVHLERTTIERLLTRNGFADEQSVRTAERMLKLVDNVELHRIEEVKHIDGLFQLDGRRRIVGLNTNLREERLLFTLAHEAVGHGLWDSFKAGQLSAPATKVLNDFNMEFRGMDESEQLLLHAELSDLVGKDYQKLFAERRGALSSYKPHERADEILADVNAMIALTALSPKSKKAFLTYMPKRVGDFLSVAYRYMKAMLDTVTGAKYVRRLMNGPEASFSQRELLHKFTKDLSGVLLDSQALRDYDNRMAATLAFANEPGAIKTYFAFPEQWGQLVDRSDPTGAVELVNSTYGPKAMLASDQSAVTGKTGFWTKNLMPFRQLGARNPELQRVVELPALLQHDWNVAQTELMAVFGLKRVGDNWEGLATAIIDVEKTPFLARKRDELQRLANLKEDTVGNLLANKDAEAEAVLTGMSNENRAMVLESVARMEKYNSVMTDLVLSSRVRKLEFQTAELLLREASLSFDAAHAQAKALVAMAGAGQPTGASPAIDALISQALSKFKTDHEFFKARPYYISEVRYGDVKFRVNKRGIGGKMESDVRTAHSRKEAEQLEARLRKEQAEGRIVNFAEVENNRTSKELLSRAAELLAERDGAYRQRLTQSLVAAGVPLDVAGPLVDSHSLGRDVQAEIFASDLPATRNKRKFKEGREELDMLQQQIIWSERLGRGLNKQLMRAGLNAHLADATVKNHPAVETVKQAYQNLFTQDPKSVRPLGVLNYINYMAFNFVNMVQDALNPITGILPSSLVSKGDGWVEAHGRITGAMKDLAAKKLSKEEKVLLEEYRKGNHGLSIYMDAEHNTALDAVNARRIAEGKEVMGLTEFLLKPATGLLNANRRLHRVFTNYGAEATLLAGYRQALKLKLSGTAAKEHAMAIVGQTMAEGGRTNRAVGAWKDGRQPLAAFFLPLQSYVLGALSNMKLQFDRGFTNKAGSMTKNERTQARKAMLTQTTSMLAFSGVLGLPLAGAALVLLEKMFGIKAREELDATLRSLTDDEDTADLIAEVGQRGLLNTLGVDLASRYSTTGTLGVNANTGFDWNSFTGPTGQIAKNFFDMSKSLFEGDVKAAGEKFPLPAPVRRAFRMWKDDFEFRDGDGTKLADSDDAMKYVYALTGLRPAQIAKTQYAVALDKVTKKIDLEDRTKKVREVLKFMRDGNDAEAQRILNDYAEEVGGDDKEATAAARGALADAVASKGVDEEFVIDPRLMTSSPRIAQMLGQVPQSSLEDRYLYENSLKQRLGADTSLDRSRLMSKRMLDALMQDQQMSLSEAQDQLPPRIRAALF